MTLKDLQLQYEWFVAHIEETKEAVNLKRRKK